MKKLNFLVVLSLLFLIAGCKNEKNNKIYKLENIPFKLEGPLFEGANSSQYELSVDLNRILGDNIASEKIKEAKLVSCQLISADSNGFNNISSFVLQLTAETADMTEVAVINPFLGASFAQLKPSDKDVSVFFNQNKFIFLIDATLKNDQEESLKFYADFIFEIKY